MKHTIKLITLLLVSFNSFALVSTTINPLYFLAKEIATPNTVQVLLANKSPHTDSLKPSQLETLHNSQVVFYVNDTLEAFMPKILPQLNTQKVINIVEHAGITLLNRKKHDEHDEHDNEHEEHHHHGTKDNHIWLSPKNAQSIAHTMAEELSKIYPQYKEIYFKNTHALMNKLHTLDAKIKQKLSKKSHKKVIIFHNAYNYVLHEYNLEDIVAKSTNNYNLSLKEMLEFKDIIKKNNISCVITGVSYNKKLIHKLIKNTDIKHQILDVIGNTKTDDYVSLMENITNKIESCL